MTPIEPEFDEYKDSYRDELRKSIAFAHQDHDFYTELKADYLLRLGTEFLGPAASLRVLDVGCGVGLTDRFLVGKVAELHGIEIAAGPLERARSAVPEAMFTAYDGQSIPFEDHRFDLAFAICVVHHVPPARWKAFIGEMKRVVKPGGLVMIFEHNHWNPGTRRVVDTCVFDRNAVLLTARETRALMTGNGLAIARSRYIVFFPFRHALLQWLDRRLGWCPLGAQYVVVGRKEGAP